MRNLLLVSSSRVHGSGYLEHCYDAIKSHFKKDQSLLFVPYALADHDKYTQLVSDALVPVGIDVTGIHQCPDPVAAINSCKGIFVGGGNSFRLLKTLYDLDLVSAIRKAVLERGVPYMGSSAGTNMACPTIRTTNDMPIVEPPSLSALNLVPFQINPHFQDPDPNSTHKGETREQRINEFHEENSTVVAGIREGSWFEIHDSDIKLHGHSGMRFFAPGKEAQEFKTGDDVTFLLKP